MKYGICVNVNKIEMAMEAGFDFVEVSLQPLAAMSEEEFLQVVALSEKYPDRLLCANWMFPGEIRLTGPDMNEETIRRHCRHAYARLARLGVKTLVFGSGWAKRVPEGFSFDEAMDQLERAVRIMGEEAKPHGQAVVIESLRRQETNIIYTVADSADLADRSGMDNVYPHADFFHFSQNEETLEGGLRPYAKRLIHVHLASPVERTAPTPEDGADYRAFFDVLREEGFDGTVSYEGKALETVDEMRALLAYMRTM